MEFFTAPEGQWLLCVQLASNVEALCFVHTVYMYISYSSRGRGTQLTDQLFGVCNCDVVLLLQIVNCILVCYLCEFYALES